jgi:hypothetical protein
MGKRTGAKVGVAAVIRSDHIQPQLQGFRHAAAESFRSVQGEEHITAAVEGEELIALYGWPQRGGCADLLLCGAVASLGVV